jgi:DNA/RNA-binding domain of Phe-tRNA-synthetase-like protein
MPGPAHELGWVAPELAEEFPELGLRHITVEAAAGRSPDAVRRRLATLAGRITGGQVVQMRQKDVPWAYRVFWRQVGMDPDTDRTPVERLAVERLVQGGLPSRNLLDDAITIATLETGVAIVAFDADTVAGAIGLRLSAEGESIGEQGPPIGARRLVIADDRRPLALLGGDIADDRQVTRATTRIVVAAVHVKGVPEMSVEEALWTVFGVLSGEG